MAGGSLRQNGLPENEADVKIRLRGRQQSSPHVKSCLRDDKIINSIFVMKMVFL
jgi:hypothetical protein